MELLKRYIEPKQSQGGSGAATVSNSANRCYSGMNPEKLGANHAGRSAMRITGIGIAKPSTLRGAFVTGITLVWSVSPRKIGNSLHMVFQDHGTSKSLQSRKADVQSADLISLIGDASISLLTTLMHVAKSVLVVGAAHADYCAIIAIFLLNDSNLVEIGSKRPSHTSLITGEA
jgi:hypothetical protein